MSISVSQLLNKKGHQIHTVSPDTTVFEAIKLMSSLGVGALLVMEGNRLVGVISERDYTRKVILKGRASASTLVQEIMTNKVICVSPSNNIDECMMLMNENHIRHLPVIEKSTVVGVITIMDVIKNILTEKEFIIEQLEHYIAGNT
ncbi:MAG: putative signal-transduction protein with CBS domain [Gammaproteobacteria bacterium]|nr:putative signal-transduction protein with CBS domain [Gammaproteobacteria bacterium]